uniref:Uncharacterized protein n=1 Tax=Plectus sambesii TaxID=2011161 RepID=A0A914UWG5_9BILA
MTVSAKRCFSTSVLLLLIVQVIGQSESEGVVDRTVLEASSNISSPVGGTDRFVVVDQTTLKTSSNAKNTIGGSDDFDDSIGSQVRSFLANVNLAMWLLMLTVCAVVIACMCKYGVFTSCADCCLLCCTAWLSSRKYGNTGSPKRDMYGPRSMNMAFGSFPMGHPNVAMVQPPSSIVII